VALSTGLLGPLIDSLIEALGGEMELGAAAADSAQPNPTRTVVNSTLKTSATGATATDEDPPF
jgi:recombination associated protein RdgC